MLWVSVDVGKTLSAAL